MSEIIVKLTGSRIKLKGGEYVRDLVRCKDCKFIYLDNHIWKCPWTIPSGFDGYCSYGKAKE